MEKENHKNPHADGTSGEVSKATSELNNLLQIIAGTSSAIENIWEGNDASEKYLAMLRESIQRAEKLTAELAHHAGGSDKKTLMNPEIAGFVKTKNAAAKNGRDIDVPRQSI